jgi:DNA helicase HerA-like ATPase
MILGDPYVAKAQLAGNESVWLAVIEVVAIPHVSVLGDREQTEGEWLAEYKADMARLLVEIHQQYRISYRSDGTLRDVSLELLWCTQPVQNQPFQASARLYLIVRCIDVDAAGAMVALGSLLDICAFTLALERYEYQLCPFDEFQQVVGALDTSAAFALTKTERIENLQNQMMPTCYAFDPLPQTGNDLARVVNSLIELPCTALSLQLTPVCYSPAEMNAIETTIQNLNTLSRGVNDGMMGSVSFAAATKLLENYLYYADNKNAALFSFGIVAYGARGAAHTVATRMIGQLDITNQMRLIPLTAGEIQLKQNFFPLPWALNEILLNTERAISSQGNEQGFAPFYRLSTIVTAQEASEFFRLPLGSDRLGAGLIVNESSKASKTFHDELIDASELEVGVLKSSAIRHTLGFSRRDLTKHMLVTGTPGSGKTTYSVGLLDRLWKEHGIPFLVIEPAKNEYRALVRSIPDLQVFTPGKSFISPLVLNPFVPPKNVRLEAYKSTLKTAFEAGVSMTSPLDKIFEESINNCYSDFRWLNSYTSDDAGGVFNISDFVKCFEETFEAIGYTGDARNIGRAGVVRLGSLVNLFDNYYSIPIEDLLTRPTLIELAAIENSDEKALIIALLLLSILAYVNSNYLGTGDLRNVIVLEEAHVLLDSSSDSAQGEADPSAVAKGLVKRMLAELRSYGVSLIIADQSPRKVTTDIVALTDIKLAFRLVEAEDKQIIADSTNMDEAQIQRLAKLRPGEAFLFFGKLEEPEEVVTPDYRLENAIDITLSDEDIAALSTYWKGKERELRPYPQCAKTPYCREGCTLSRRELASEVARRIFVRHFKAETDRLDPLVEVLGRISSLVKDELNDESFDRPLLSCTKVHLFRRILYGTKLKVPKKTIDNSLTKE